MRLVLTMATAVLAFSFAATAGATPKGVVGGAATGAVGGALVAGPPGAVVGAVGGAIVGNHATNKHRARYRHHRHHQAPAKPQS